jgi:Transcriptional regulator PadR-like family
MVECLPWPEQKPERANLLQGTLDMLILRTLLYGPAHGHQIGKYIQRTTNDFLQMQHGSLYPALHRLERRGWVTSKWEMAPIFFGACAVGVIGAIIGYLPKRTQMPLNYPHGCSILELR